jgi:ribosomal protein S20
MKAIVADITRLLDEGESKKGEYMAWWKRQRELINGHYDVAANSGYSKKVIKAIDTGAADAARAALAAAEPVLDRYAARGLIHKNKAARHKSRLTARIKAMA